MVTALSVLFFSVASQINARPIAICIDPGHPSEVGRGTRGKEVTEIHVAWEVAKRMERILQSRNVKVALTKQAEDQFVKNVDRAKLANEFHADLTVRLHCDASSGTGFATYFPDRQGTQEGYTGPSLELIERIRPIADRFHSALKGALSGFLKDNGLKSDTKTAVGAKYGALIGSIHSTVPVVLVEMCVLTNPSDEAKVSTPDGQERLALALAEACIKSLVKPQ